MGDIGDIDVGFVRLLIENDIGQSGIRVRDFSVERAAENGENYGSVILRIRVGYYREDDSCPSNGDYWKASYVGKFMPVQPQHYQTIKNFKIFDREILVYQKLLPAALKLQEEPKIRPDVPLCVFAGVTPFEAVVMRDLKEEGFKLADRIQGLNVAEFRLVMEAYGKFHSFGFLLVQKTDLASHELLQENPFEKFPDSDQFIRNSMVTLRKLLEETPGQENNVQRLSRFIQEKAKDGNHFKSFMRPRGSRKTILHGDCWSNNMMFRYENDEPVEVRLLDLQMIRLGNPSQDLLHALYTCTSRSIHRDQTEFYKIYHQSLMRHCEALGIHLDYTFESLLEDVEANREFGFFMAVFQIPVILMEKGDAPDLTKTDMDPETMLQMREKSLFSRTNVVVKQRMLELVDDMVASKVL